VKFNEHKQIRELCGLIQRDVTHIVSELEGASERLLQTNHSALPSQSMGSSLLKEGWTAPTIPCSGATLAEPLKLIARQPLGWGREATWRGGRDGTAMLPLRSRPPSTDAADRAAHN